LHGEYSDRGPVALTPRSVAVRWEAACRLSGATCCTLRESGR